MLEICYECGRSVKWGSGWFVNRVACGDSYEENVEAGRPFPRGQYLCGECDERIFGEGVCEGCGEVIQDEQSVIKGENRHAVCS